MTFSRFSLLLKGIAENKIWNKFVENKWLYIFMLSYYTTAKQESFIQKYQM